MLTPHLGPRCLGRVVPGWVPGLSVHRRARTHARPLGVVAADPFGPLLLPPDTDTAPSSQPDLFGEFLNSAAPATQPTPFPSTHSAPPPACSTNFLRLGEGGHGLRSSLPAGEGAQPVSAPCTRLGSGGRRQVWGCRCVAGCSGRRPLKNLSRNQTLVSAPPSESPLANPARRVLSLREPVGGRPGGCEHSLRGPWCPAEPS